MLPNLTPISGITSYEETASLPNPISEVEVAAVKEPGESWGVYIEGREEYRETPAVAKLIANAIMIAALQADLLNAGHPIGDALHLVDELTAVK